MRVDAHGIAVPKIDERVGQWRAVVRVDDEDGQTKGNACFAFTKQARHDEHADLDSARYARDILSDSRIPVVGSLGSLRCE